MPFGTAQTLMVHIRKYPPPLPGLVVLLMISDCHGGCHGDAVTYELLVRLVFNQVLRSQKQIKVIILTNHKAHSQPSEPI